MASGRDAGGGLDRQLIRLDAFRAGHPGVIVGEAEFSGWDATIPLDGDGERFLHRDDLAVLLDDAEAICGGGDPRAHPD
jgi:hypothetical protein